MATIFLRVKAPNSGFFFVGNVILKEEAWTPVEVNGLSLYMRSTIISALENGYIKGDKLNADIIAELSSSMTQREIETAIGQIGMANCCCLSSMLIDQPFISSHTNHELNVPLQFAITTFPYMTTPAYNDVHTSTDWEITSDPNYENVVWSSYDDELNKVYVIVQTGIEYDGIYYIRARFKSNSFYSRWSESIIIHALNTPTP